jgi:hypothetical protein
LTEAHAGFALPARIVRVQRTADGIELYYPPGRMPQVALALAAFGAIACALSLIGTAVMLDSAMVSTAGVLVAVMMASFVAPLGVFGVIFLGLSVYMVANALRVRVGPEGIATSRRLFGLVVSRKRVTREALVELAPEIASRHQNLFSAEPVYQLVARDAGRRTRVVVAESLQGEALMDGVRSLIESVIGPFKPH